MITIIIHRSAGNESVGTQWHESFQFEDSTTLRQVIDTVLPKDGHIREDIIIPLQN